MYLRHSKVKKNGKTHTYWCLVRSVRQGRKVRQETVAYLTALTIFFFRSLALRGTLSNAYSVSPAPDLRKVDLDGIRSSCRTRGPPCNGRCVSSSRFLPRLSLSRIRRTRQRVGRMSPLSREC